MSLQGRGIDCWAHFAGKRYKLGRLSQDQLRLLIYRSVVII